MADPVRYRVSAAGAGDRAATDHWTDRVARITQLPAAIAGAGLSTYTASLLSATSTPFWAGAPESLAVRFGSSSVAAGAAALSLGERREGNHRLARDLDLITLAALSAELAATVRSESVLHRKGVSAAEDGAPVTQNLALLGTVLPIGLHLAALAVGRRGSLLSQLASVATLAGSLCLRVGVLEAGDESVRRPQDGFRLAKPHNLPRS